MNVAERVAELVQIPSVNPLQAGPISGDDGERSISSWLADRADALGADVTVDEVIDGSIASRLETARRRLAG